MECDDPDDMFDIDCFREMLQAYLPASQLVKDESLSKCVMKLVQELKDDRDSKDLIPGVDIKSLIAVTTQQPAPNQQQSRKNRSISETSDDYDKKKKGGPRTSESQE